MEELWKYFDPRWVTMSPVISILMKFVIIPVLKLFLPMEGRKTVFYVFLSTVIVTIIVGYAFGINTNIMPDLFKSILIGIITGATAIGIDIGIKTTTGSNVIIVKNK